MVSCLTSHPLTSTQASSTMSRLQQDPAMPCPSVTIIGTPILPPPIYLPHEAKCHQSYCWPKSYSLLIPAMESFQHNLYRNTCFEWPWHLL